MWGTVNNQPQALVRAPRPAAHSLALTNHMV
jgi:hypothetical protein